MIARGTPFVQPVEAWLPELRDIHASGAEVASPLGGGAHSAGSQVLTSALDLQGRTDVSPQDAIVFALITRFADGLEYRRSALDRGS